MACRARVDATPAIRRGGRPLRAQAQLLAQVAALTARLKVADHEIGALNADNIDGHRTITTLRPPIQALSDRIASLEALLITTTAEYVRVMDKIAADRAALNA